jgi:adenosylcobinamide-phosphate synthase
MNGLIAVLTFAFIVDCLIGDPVYPFHPTRLIGKIITFFEKILEKMRLFNIFGGAVFVFFVLVFVLSIYSFFAFLFRGFNYYIYLAFEIFVVYSAIALKDMMIHADRVYDALINKDLKKAQSAVQMIVGRDAKRLDEVGVASAAIESLSENFVDGFFAVVFWYVVGGIMGFLLNGDTLFFGGFFAISYRSINTMDSMVGYRNERYEKFGKVAAKLDDFVNFIPARLSVIFICFCAFLLKKDSKGCIKTAKEDRLKHSSPNSAHAESAVAGALNVKLGGKIVYPHITIEKPYIGGAYSLPNIDNIKETEKLLFYSAVLLVVVVDVCLGIM